MANEKHKFRFKFEFIMPAERIMAVARNNLDSPDENLRSVAKAVLDVTAEASKIKSAMAEDKDADLGPYFDFWFADALNCANQLLDCEEPDARNLARCLIDIERATVKSKESFLVEMKRLGLRPGG
jgi:hypothetical protein